jgi:RNA polymerase sigma factor (sigma-70 family)
MSTHAVAQPSPRKVALPLRLLSDERLARQVGAGQEEAFVLLYQRHHQALYRYCRSLVGTDADAQDALQSAMTGALVALRGSRRDAPVRPWLFRIAHNESISLLRRRRPEQQLPTELPIPERSADEVAEERARLARLMADLRELPERQRGVLVMRELSGLSHEEVAQAFGMSVGAAKQTVFEARRSLMEFSEGRTMPCEDVQRLISDGDRRALRGRRVRAHLRECSGCSAFAAAIPARQADLHAVAPVLPVAAAAGLFGQITGLTSSSSAGGSASIAAGATGKAIAVGATGKLVGTGTVIVVTAALGAGTALRVLTLSGGPSASGAAHARPALTLTGPGAAGRHAHSLPEPRVPGAPTHKGGRQAAHSRSVAAQPGVSASHGQRSRSRSHARSHARGQGAATGQSHRYGAPQTRGSGSSSSQGTTHRSAPGSGSSRPAPTPKPGTGQAGGTTHSSTSGTALPGTSATGKPALPSVPPGGTTSSGAAATRGVR